jgi:hypothetical protein
MTDHMTQSLTDFAAAITADGVVDAEEVAKIRERIFADDVIDREEADFLFAINDAVSTGNNDAAWTALFVEALTSHVLRDETSPDVLDEAEAQYLMEKIQGDQQVDATELALLVNICASATSSPASFQAFVLSSVKTAVLTDGVIDEAEVEMIRKVVYGSGGGAGASVDRAEADFLFDLNEATSGKENHPAWKALFIEAISKHLLEDETSPGVVDEAEGDWLVSRVEGDEQYDENEKALLANIKQNAQSISGKLKFKMELFQV